jgi:hypothetical protein
MPARSVAVLCGTPKHARGKEKGSAGKVFGSLFRAW